MMSCFVEEESRVTLQSVDTAAQELRWRWLEEREEEQLQDKTSTPASAEPLASLVVYRGGQLVDQKTIHKFPFVIGRSSANDLVVLDKEVSRRHALIDRIGGIFVIEDLNSKNGILINRTRRSRALLRSGDIISFGQLDVSFHAASDPGNTDMPADEGDEISHVATIAGDPDIGLPDIDDTGELAKHKIP